MNPPAGHCYSQAALRSCPSLGSARLRCFGTHLGGVPAAINKTPQKRLLPTREQPDAPVREKTAESHGLLLCLAALADRCCVGGCCSGVVG